MRPSYHRVGPCTRASALLATASCGRWPARTSRLTTWTPSLSARCAEASVPPCERSPHGDGGGRRRPRVYDSGARDVAVTLRPPTCCTFGKMRSRCRNSDPEGLRLIPATSRRPAICSGRSPLLTTPRGQRGCQLAPEPGAVSYTHLTL